ncbi:ribonuclease HI [Bradyrhizobium sp. IAR9]|uniref:RNase H family protein n=1 Tax=Bradyrhizobium sp. IAR9 TaxID=2663841 RepID=UPI0015C9A851|nr:RNase H family protein [Bradyrhizobium sp. IAR9]NYG46517.1 ribonuclease HI [Bradyrhizobium sp. IAR9]
MKAASQSTPALPLPRNEPFLPTADYVIFLDSSDLPNEDGSGPSACVWQIRTMDGRIVNDSEAKQSRTKCSDEKRALVAALVGALEAVGDGSFCLVYATGTYITDGVKHACNWKARGWRNSHNEPVASPDIWDRYLELLDNRDLEVRARSWKKEYCTELRRHLNERAKGACGDRN